MRKQWMLCLLTAVLLLTAACQTDAPQNTVPSAATSESEAPSLPTAQTTPTEAAPPSGCYLLEAVYVDGRAAEVDDFAPAGIATAFIEFLADGTGSLYAVTGEEPFRWDADGITFSGDETRVAYSLDGDTLVMEQDGIQMTFAAGEKPELPAAPQALEAYWDTGWYGWWAMENCTGDFAPLEGYCWDLCAETDISADGSGTLSLWDETFSRSEPLGSAEIQILTDGAVSEVGYLTTLGGWFELADVPAGAWTADPNGTELPNLLLFSGRWEDGESGYDYVIVLRPWGTRWEDADTVHLPYYYEDWYLPLIEAGDAMPDYISPVAPAG